MYFIIEDSYDGITVHRHESKECAEEKILQIKNKKLDKDNNGNYIITVIKGEEVEVKPKTRCIEYEIVED